MSSDSSKSSAADIELLKAKVAEISAVVPHALTGLGLFIAVNTVS